jgi:hypothetical protein
METELVNQPDVMPNDPGLTTEPEIQPEVQPVEPIEPVVPQPEVSATEQPASPPKEPAPADIVRMLKELAKERPDFAPVAKNLQDSFYATKAYREIFENIDNARSLHATMEAVGGAEGLLDLQTRVEDLDNIDRMAHEGDPQLMMALAAEEPEGFKKLVPVALEQLERLDSKAYDTALRMPLIKALEASGMRQTMARAVRFLQAGHSDLAQQEIASVAEWLNGLNEELQKAPQQPAFQPSGPMQRTQQDDPAQEAFSNQIVTEGNAWLEQRIQAALKPLSKGLSEGAVSDLAQGVMNELDKELGKNSTYQKQLTTLRKSLDADRTLRYIKANADPLIQRLANTVYSRRYTGPARAAVQQTGQPAQPQVNQQVAARPGSPRLMPKMPTPDQIDHDKTDMRLLMTHKAYLRDGTLVTWPWRRD